MTDDERRRWDQRYADGEYVARSWPSPFLEHWLPRIPVGRALDVACGAGRNALRLAEAGFEAHGVDISSVAIERARAEAEGRGLEVSWEVADLDDLAIPESAYDLVVVTRFRNPDLWPRLVRALAPDGWLLIEHHLRTTAEVQGPGSPAFRVEPQELLRAARDLRVVHYSEQLEPADAPGAPYALARLAACNGDPGF